VQTVKKEENIKTKWRKKKNIPTRPFILSLSFVKFTNNIDIGIGNLGIGIGLLPGRIEPAIPKKKWWPQYFDFRATRALFKNVFN